MLSYYALSLQLIFYSVLFSVFIHVGIYIYIALVHFKCQTVFHSSKPWFIDPLLTDGLVNRSVVHPCNYSSVVQTSLVPVHMQEFLWGEIELL